jgi:hypothetical protein
MKFLHRIRAGHLATLAAGLAIGFTAVGTASAAAGSAAGPAAATTVNNYSIAASAFAPDGLHTTTNDYFNLWNPSTLSNTDSGRCFNAGVALPNGAKLKSVTFFYTNGATDSLSGNLNRQNLGLHTSKVLGSFDSTPTGTSPAYSHTSLNIPSSLATVNTQYAYSVGVCPFGDATFTGITISYTG